MRRAIPVTLTASAALGLAACAHDDFRGWPGYAAPHSPYVYAGRTWAERRLYSGELRGPGVAMLDPWLRETREGRAIVTLGFHAAAEGFVSEEIADRANIWFRHYADSDRDMRITDPEIRTALVAAAGRFAHR
jgi:hypothetical protein